MRYKHISIAVGSGHLYTSTHHYDRNLLSRGSAMSAVSEVYRPVKMTGANTAAPKRIHKKPNLTLSLIAKADERVQCGMRFTRVPLPLRFSSTAQVGRREPHVTRRQSAISARIQGNPVLRDWTYFLILTAICCIVWAMHAPPVPVHRSATPPTPAPPLVWSPEPTKHPASHKGKPSHASQPDTVYILNPDCCTGLRQ